MSEKTWHLKNCDLFERLAADELKGLEMRCRARKFPRGSPIYLPADDADGVLLLTSGRVKICSFSVDGKQAILTFIEPGELFGELAMLDQETREEYAEAAEACTLLLIPADAMHDLMAQHTGVSLGVTKLFGMRRQRIERRLKYLLFRSNRERLIHLLLELAEQYGSRTADGVALGIKLSHQELANIIGSTRETVTVVLGALQNEGSLKLGRRKIVLTNLDRLAQSVQVSPPRIERPTRSSSLRM
ncbi:MAG: Crp/Fnr family transcriptional regulator [Pirellulales bacterium]